MDLNKVFLGGNLTRDPESRYTPGGSQVVQFGMAINRRYRTRDGQDQEETCFVDVEVWGGQAESCVQYLHRGDPVIVEGRLRFDSWDDKETGRKRSSLTVTAERVQFLSRMMDGDGDSGRSGGRGRDDRGGYRDDRRGGRGDSRRDGRDSRRRDDDRGGRRRDDRGGRGGRDGGAPPPFPSDDGAPPSGGRRRGDSRSSAPGPFDTDDDSVDDIPF